MTPMENSGVIYAFDTIEFWFGLSVGALISDVAKKTIKHRFSSATSRKSDDEDGEGAGDTK